MDLQLRTAVAADLPAIARLERESFGEPWSPTALEQALQDTRTVVLVAQNSYGIIGYATGWYVGDEAEISRLAVLPQDRRGGLGKRLLQLLLQEFEKQGVARVFLEVRSSNLAALRLYENTGFLQVGLRRRYYENGEDAVVMSVELAVDEEGME